MRILHVIDSLAGSGGAEHGLVREITRFSPATEQRVVRLFDRAELQPQLESAGIEVHAAGLSSGGGVRPWVQGIGRVRGEIRDFQPDVVHTSLFLANAIGQIAARLERVPVVSNLVLSGDPQLLRNNQPGADTWRAAVARSLGGWAARRSRARFRALTTHALTTNARLLGVPVDRGEVIPRGVPGPVDEPMSRAELGLPNDCPLVVNVGRLAAQKGQVHLIRAFALVLERHPDAVLVIVGREGDASDVVRRAISDHRLADSVILTGYTPHVGHFLAHGSVFAFPSLMEGLGTSVLEAMAAGLPVVAFDIPPVREITGDGEVARLVPLRDEVALASAIEEGLDGDLEDLAAAGNRQCLANYSVDAIAERVESFLRSCANTT